MKLALALATLPLVLGGCDLLYAYLDPMAMDPNGLTEPSTQTSYGKGTATMELTQDGTTETIILGRVGASSMLDSWFGATVSWENDDGWTVTINAYDMSNFGPDLSAPGVTSGDVTISRIDGLDYWTAGSYTSWGTGNGCIVDVWEMTEAKLSGRVNCSDLKWTDAMDPSLEQPAYVSGQEPFDLTITFEAVPVANVNPSS
ncbi:MAG: hypothetical protein WD830_11735 [Chloroflexota bacterium]